MVRKENTKKRWSQQTKERRSTSKNFDRSSDREIVKSIRPIRPVFKNKK